MNVRLIKEGWGEPKNGLSTFEMQILFGAVRTGSVLRISKCVPTPAAHKWVEVEVKEEAGREIVSRLSEAYRKGA